MSQCFSQPLQKKLKYKNLITKNLNPFGNLIFLQLNFGNTISTKQLCMRIDDEMQTIHDAHSFLKRYY